MTARTIYSHLTSPPPSGLDFLQQDFVLKTILFDESVLTLTNVAGTDTITADVEPEMPAAGWATGMKFLLTPVADNTGPATLNVGGAGAKAIVAGDGSALQAGDLLSGTTYLVAYNGTNVRVLGVSPSALSGGGVQYLTFSVTTVLENTFDPDTLLMPFCWGAGSGSSSGEGGGGGACEWGLLRAGDLADYITITVAAAAAANTPGGDTSFGSHVVAHGGGATGDLARGARVGPDEDRVSGAYGGGDGNTGGDGAGAMFGGGGGAGTLSGSVGGRSSFGGDGGAKDAPGATPGGGGGSGLQPGGAGFCFVIVLGA